MTPLAQIEALLSSWSDTPIPSLLTELHNPTPGSELRRLAAAQALSRRSNLPPDAIDSLTTALGDSGSVNMEPWITPDPYMTPPEAIRHDSVADAALDALIHQGHAALRSICLAFSRRRAHGYQLLRFLREIGGEALLRTPLAVQTDCQTLVSQRADHDGQRAAMILAWASTHQQAADLLLAQLLCPIGTVRAKAAEGLASRDGTKSLAALLSAAQSTDAEAVCGAVRALHRVIPLCAPLDDAAIQTLTTLASGTVASAELIKVCEIFGVIGPRAQAAVPALRKLASRTPIDIYDYHSRAISQAASVALRSILPGS